MVVWIMLFIGITTVWAYPVKNINCEFPDWLRDSEFNFDYSSFELNLRETLREISLVDVLVSGDLEIDPVFHITKTVENSTENDWMGYRLLLNGEGCIFPDTIISSDVFQKITRPTENEIVFEQPEIVPIGGTVTLEFDIQVSGTGPFEFTLTQEPLFIPEPISILLFGFGGFILHFSK